MIGPDESLYQSPKVVIGPDDSLYQKERLFQTTKKRDWSRWQFIPKRVISPDESLYQSPKGVIGTDDS